MSVRAYGLLWSYPAGEVPVARHDRPGSFARGMIHSADPASVGPDRYALGLGWLLDGIRR